MIVFVCVCVCADNDFQCTHTHTQTDSVAKVNELNSQTVTEFESDTHRSVSDKQKRPSGSTLHHTQYWAHHVVTLIDQLRDLNGEGAEGKREGKQLGPKAIGRGSFVPGERKNGHFSPPSPVERFV